ncbi:CAP domain-containing protein [Qipengyuania sp. DSG2-2]|uniref:CAP domain-containing protein n=1 Tax=Qipengyuania sp. DGS2-2 TaxID=3349631 RepID=UPI0036D27767
MRRPYSASVFTAALMMSSACTAQETAPVQSTGTPVIAAPEAPEEEAQPIDLFALSFLQSHNRARAEVAAQPLTWSAELAEDAAEYAEVLAGLNRIEHASEEARGGAGENLWIGTTGYFSTTAMMDAFLTEKEIFKPGVFPDVSTTGNWVDVGHYTQIIWKETEEVGCAIAANAQNDVLVCRYLPAGNWRGTPMP